MKAHLRTTIETLLKNGTSQRQIERLTKVDRKTIRRYVRHKATPAADPPPAATELPPPRPSARKPGAASACVPYRPWIEEQVQLGRNAQAIYQDLVERGFAHKYNSVKRFVHTLKACDPARFDVLEFKPSEEAQVDYGQGAMTRHPSGKYRRPYLFVMTLAYSSKAFRKVVWKTDQQIWAQLHEEAFRSFGGSVRYVVCDNLKEGVLKPDLYQPQLNPVYSAVLAHYSAVADPCRVRDPDRKGAVERQIRYTQDTALKDDGSNQSRSKMLTSRAGKSAGRQPASTAARNAR